MHKISVSLLFIFTPNSQREGIYLNKGVARSPILQWEGNLEPVDSYLGL